MAIRIQNDKTIINGVELPSDFKVASVLNNIAISSDGRYAVVSGKNLLLGQIPDSGRIEADGTVIQYNKATGAVSVRQAGVVSGFSASSINISAGAESNLENQINEFYSDVHAVHVNLVSGDLKLDVSLDDKVYLRGRVTEKPDYVSRDLVINGIDGKAKLLLPRNAGIMQMISVVDGDVSGTIANQGVISVTSGDISLKLAAPFVVDARAVGGGVKIKGMVLGAGSTYVPPSGAVDAALRLYTVNGDISVKYLLD